MCAKKTEVKPYHHGNLKEELIDKGLEYIDKYGVESLSMRKLAEASGVSSAAPYAHFKNKDAFLDAVQDHITESLTEALKSAYENSGEREVLIELGKSYVIFFYENPLYYQFLFARRSIDIDTFPPFQFYGEVAAVALKNMHSKRLTKETIRKKTITMWATVHGLARFALMDGVIDTDNLDKEIEQLLCSIEV